MLDPPWNPVNRQYDRNGVSWGPVTYTATVTHPQPSALFSNGLSSVQFLPNENILLTSGRQGYLVELNPNKDIVWEYKIPLRNGNPVEQGDSLPNNANLVFSATKYPLDYPAFVRKPLGGRVWLELNPDTLACPVTTSTMNKNPPKMQIYPNPATDFFTLETDAGIKRHIVFSSQGQIMRQGLTDFEGKTTVLTNHWPPGVYFVHVTDHLTAKVIVP